MAKQKRNMRVRASLSDMVQMKVRVRASLSDIV